MGQIVMFIQEMEMGQSISKTAGHVGCSRYSLVSMYEKWPKEGNPMLTDAHGEQKPGCLSELNAH